MVSAILLAAGRSKRMGVRDKLLLKYKGHWLINHVMQQLWAANIDELIIVRKDNSENLLGGKNADRIKIALNPHAEKGMTTSIQAGVRMAKREAQGFMICQADMPLITTNDYNQIIAAFKSNITDNPRLITLPFFQNQKGNPVILSAAYRQDILAHLDMEGCRALVNANFDQVLKVEMPDNHVLVDVDSKEDWDRLCFSKN